MSMHKYGSRPKISYASREEAERAIPNLSHPVHLSEAYRCMKCGAWHVGRKGFTRREKQRLKRANRYDEQLVGRLIGILRHPYIRTSKGKGK